MDAVKHGKGIMQGVLLFKETFDMLCEDVSAEQAQALLDCVRKYAFLGEDPEALPVPVGLKAVWRLLRSSVDASAAQYANKSNSGSYAAYRRQFYRKNGKNAVPMSFEEWEEQNGIFAEEVLDASSRYHGKRKQTTVNDRNAPLLTEQEREQDLEQEQDRERDPKREREHDPEQEQDLERRITRIREAQKQNEQEAEEERRKAREVFEDLKRSLSI